MTQVAMSSMRCKWYWSSVCVAVKINLLSPCASTLINYLFSPKSVPTKQLSMLKQSNVENSFLQMQWYVQPLSSLSLAESGFPWSLSGSPRTSTCELWHCTVCVPPLDGDLEVGKLCCRINQPLPSNIFLEHSKHFLPSHKRRVHTRSHYRSGL